VASNFDHRLHAVLAAHDAPWDAVIASSEVGWRKPAAGFFHAVCERLSLKPNQVLYVGDDRSNDYEGAINAGVRALLYDPAKSHPDCAHITALDLLYMRCS